MRTLTPNQIETAKNAALGTAYTVIVGAVALWGLAALVVGSVVVARWIEGVA